MNCYKIFDVDVVSLSFIVIVVLSGLILVMFCATVVLDLRLTLPLCISYVAQAAQPAQIDDISSVDKGRNSGEWVSKIGENSKHSFYHTIGNRYIETRFIVVDTIILAQFDSAWRRLLVRQQPNTVLVLKKSSVWLCTCSIWQRQANRSRRYIQTTTKLLVWK